MEKAQMELDTVIGTGHATESRRIMKWADRAKLDYTNACINVLQKYGK
jgi:hypothetical protein